MRSILAAFMVSTLVAIVFAILSLLDATLVPTLAPPCALLSSLATAPWSNPLPKLWTIDWDDECVSSTRHEYIFTDASSVKLAYDQKKSKSFNAYAIFTNCYSDSNCHLLEVDAHSACGVTFDQIPHVINQIQIPRVFVVDFLQ
jgi:hypothetical protein